MTTSTPVGHCDAGRNEWLESRMMRNVSCPVRRGADGKGPGHRNLASRLPYDLIAQLKGGVHALRAAVDNLVSNGASMVMTALAWNLKAWFALSVPEHPRHKEVHREPKRSLLRMEFKRFVNTIILMPCQIVRGGHRVLYRLLSWNNWQGVFLRVVHALRCGSPVRAKPGSGCPGPPSRQEPKGRRRG